MNTNIISNIPEKINRPPADSQCGMILEHLEQYGSITALDALGDYGIMRLAARIADLKRLGYPITAKQESGKNRRGDTVYYTRYFLKGNEKK